MIKIIGEMPTGYDTKEWALWYAKQGLYIVPVASPGMKSKGKAAEGKEPIMKDWCTQAPNDPAKVHSLFNFRNNNINIGIATGSNHGSIVVVDLDIDEEKGKNGYEVLKEWEREHGAFPETWTAITGRGGYHFYYKSDIAYRSVKNLYDGVDVRADKGMVVAPPSIHKNGNRYEWETAPCDMPMAEMNDSVREFLKGALETEIKKNKKPFELPEKIMKGNRTDSFISLIGKMKRDGVSDEAIKQAIIIENESRCEPKMDMAELESTVFTALSRDWNAEEAYYDNRIEKGYAEHMKTIVTMSDGYAVDVIEFHKVSDKGVVKGVIDDKIVNFIIEHENIIVIENKPYLYANGVYKLDNFGKNTKQIIKSLIFQNLITINVINRIYELLISIPSIEVQIEETNKYPSTWINFKNGMLDVVTGKMYDHSPKYYSINQIPHNYIPGLDITKSVFYQFLESRVPDQENKRMLFEYMGYSLTKDFDYCNFLILQGIGDAGKSTILNFISEIVGADNVSNVSLHNLGERFTVASLLFKTLNYCGDISNAAIRDSSGIKQMTGDDRIKGEYKQGSIFFFKSKAKQIFSCNDMPRILDEQSDGFYRRLLILKFPEKGDFVPNLKERLADEKEMETVISGIVEALKGVFKGKKLYKSSESIQEVAQLWNDSDSVKAFLRDRVELDASKKVKRADMFGNYQNYCAEEGMIALGKTLFFRSLEAKGYSPKKSNGEYYYKGMDIKFIPTSKGYFDNN